MKVSTATQLQKLGYDGSAADLATFTAAIGPTADVDAALAAAVTQRELHPDTFIPGMKNDRIRAAEDGLHKLGFAVGPKDGVMDAQLADAVAAFKAKHPLANVGRFLGTGASAAIAREAAPHQALVLGEISKKAWAEVFPKLKEQLLSGKLPHGVPISIGTYGIDAAMGRDIEGPRSLGANVKFTPAFSLVQKDKTRRPWSGRAEGLGGDPKYAGVVPAYQDLETDAERYAWGQEIGRRFRDALAVANAKGIKTDGWMLDEIWGSAGKSEADGGQAVRELSRGVLDGLRLGRDGREMKGLVYLASLPGLVNAEQTPEMKKFWASLNAASTQVIQEEYPIFARGVEGAQANAENANRADAKLATLGPTGAALARKIISGMSPGYNAGATHGTFKEAGKLPDGTRLWESLGLTPRQVQQWREAYMNAREAAGVVGFGEYGLLNDNAAGAVIDPMLEQLVEEVA